MEKRGLSTVITSLILILLVLVAIGVVWIVVKNIMEKQSDEVSLGKLLIDAKIEAAQVDTNGAATVTIKRNPGQGEIAGMNFIFSDGTNTLLIERTTSILELGTQEFTFSSTELSSLGTINEVSIYPIIKSNSGKNTILNKADTSKVNLAISYYCDEDSDTYISDTITGTCFNTGCEPVSCTTTIGNDCNDANININPAAAEICGNGIDEDCTGLADDGACLAIGLMAHYSFDGGTAVDDTGNGHTGSVFGATWISNGGYNGLGAYSFDGIDDSIFVIPDGTMEQPDITITAWVKANSLSGNQGINTKHDMVQSTARGWTMYLQNSALACAWGNTPLDAWGNSQVFAGSLTINEWYFIACSFKNQPSANNELNAHLGKLSGTLSNPTSTTIYDIFYETPLKGVEMGKRTQGGLPLEHYNGLIDDVRIYNRALPPSEINALFNS
ncbi:MAG: LamG-like jellyroll fold domain-containing protein [Candidatus Nanoarchaeia archaeon]